MAAKKATSRARMDGVFDWILSALRRAAPPVPGIHPPEARGLVVRPAEPALPAAPRPAVPSIFQAFIPSALPAAPREAPLIFRAFRPALPAVPPPPEAVPPAVWEALYAPPAEEEIPVAEIFAPFAPEPVVPALPPEPSSWGVVFAPGRPWTEAAEWTRNYPDIAARTGGRMPLWVAFNLGWEMPPTIMLVEAIRAMWDLPMVFEQVLVSIEDPGWRRAVEDSAHTGEPATLEVEPIGSRYDPYGDLARFFGVPDALIERYARSPEGGEMLASEIIEPLLVRFTKAMEILKPRGLRGWFEVEPSFDGNLWLKYKEALFGVPTA